MKTARVKEERINRNQKSDSDRSIKLKTEIKHLTVRRNDLKKIIELDGNATKLFIGNGSPITTLPLEEEIITNQRGSHVNERSQELQKNEKNDFVVTIAA